MTNTRMVDLATLWSSAHPKLDTIRRCLLEIDLWTYTLPRLRRKLRASGLLTYDVVSFPTVPVVVACHTATKRSNGPTRVVTVRQLKMSSRLLICCRLIDDLSNAVGLPVRIWGRLTKCPECADTDRTRWLNMPPKCGSRR